QPLGIFIVTEQLGLSKESLQWLLTVNGAGMIVGGALAMVFAKNVAPQKMLIIGMLGQAIGIGIIDKRRPRPNVSEVMNIIGNIEGKTAILIDDIIDTAGTITLAANALVENGASEVYACCTHPVLSGPAIERIQNSNIKELVVTNSIVLPEEKKIDKVHELSVAPLIGEAIIRVYEEESVSVLFN
ncbi:ribose-phosphate diphosphokinase, partial [Bacillus sp. D-CC]